LSDRCLGLSPARVARLAAPSAEQSAEADDLLQDLFMKTLRQGDRFSSVHNARARLSEVARDASDPAARFLPGSVAVMPEYLGG
jgi:hypothetical protein